MSKKKKYYAVKRGRAIGIFYDWNTCKAQVDGYSNPVFKSFYAIEEANNFIKEDSVPTYKEARYIKNSLNCDGAYSSSSGIMEYKICDTSNGLVLRKKQYIAGTNNLAEFLALVEAIKMSKGMIPVYTDSITAIAWVRNRKINSVFDVESCSDLNKDLNDSIDFLKNCSFEYEVLKWDTKKWGEIPSDFNRK